MNSVLSAVPEGIADKTLFIILPYSLNAPSPSKAAIRDEAKPAIIVNSEQICQRSNFYLMHTKVGFYLSVCYVPATRNRF